VSIYADFIKLISAAIFIILTGCGCGCAKFDYAGDGAFTDRGIYASSKRYVLDLGRIDFSVANKKTYVIGDLPNVDTLGLYLYFDKDNYPGLDEKLYKISTGSRIRILISSFETKSIVFKYSGVLYEDGKVNGKYFRRGISPAGTSYGYTEYIGFTIPYDFNDKIKVFGIETPFFDNFKRALEIEILEPIEFGGSDGVGTGAASNGGVVANIYIFGGDW
jgi:hypothetical protein